MSKELIERLDRCIESAEWEGTRDVETLIETKRHIATLEAALVKAIANTSAAMDNTNRAIECAKQIESALAEQRQINANITEAARKESIRAGDLERDAARYQLLRDDERFTVEYMGREHSHEYLDQATDAARATSPGTSPQTIL